MKNGVLVQVGLSYKNQAITKKKTALNVIEIFQMFGYQIVFGESVDTGVWTVYFPKRLANKLEKKGYLELTALNGYKLEAEMP